MSCLNTLHHELAPFALGELDPARVPELLEHVARCPACSKELDLLADIVAIAAHPRAIAVPRERSAYRRYGPRIALVIVAGFFVLGLIDPWSDSTRKSPTAELADRSVPALQSFDPSGVASPLSDEFESALDGWERGAYEDVERALSAFLDVHPNYAPARFYRAIAHRELGRLDAARIDLRALVSSTQGALHDQASWVLANLELEAGAPDAAKQALEPLIDPEGEYTERARDLKSRIESAR